MARDKKKKEDNKEIKDVKKLNSLFNNVIQSITYAVTDTDNKNKNEINKINDDVEKIINKELDDTKSITGDDMSQFIVKLFNSDDNVYNTTGGYAIKDMEDIFASDSSGLFQFFQERYKDKNLLYEDLNMITSQLFELDEAVNTTRDAIITSDNISKSVSRDLSFNNISKQEMSAAYIMAVEKLETQLKLPTRIKNLIIPYCLRYGEYYVNVCPYSVLFEQQYRYKMNDMSNRTSLKENINSEDIKPLYESFISESDIKIKEKDFYNNIMNVAENIEIYNDCYSIPLLEGIDITGLLSDDKFNKSVSGAIKKNSSSVKQMDGVIDIGNKDTKDLFKDQTDCYIRYIDPRKLIPIEVLDHTLGYYYIHEVDVVTNRAPFTNTMRISNSINEYNNEIDTMFISKIADMVVKAFDRDFLIKNEKFKDMILNALIYNDLYKKQIKFQFIPADYIVRFKVNEDEEGRGQSILTKSLFYAKLYLSLLIFKMITIVTKSNDTKIYYVKNSGLEQNITNKVQEVARSVKQKQINFMDLLNYNSIISKIGANKEIFMPVGRTGDKGIEFDILSGQDVQINTDLMEMLRTNMINGTGVPSVIMNYINEADYAKTLTMANSKFIGRVISLQMDLNESLTELYKKIVKYSNINIPIEDIEHLEYILHPPKSLNTSNLSDFIGTADSVISASIKALTGENAEQTNDDNMVKDVLYKKMMKKYVPSIDWEEMEEMMKESRLEVEELKSKKITEENT